MNNKSEVTDNDLEIVIDDLVDETIADLQTSEAEKEIEMTLNEELGYMIDDPENQDFVLDVMKKHLGTPPIGIDLNTPESKDNFFKKGVSRGAFLLRNILNQKKYSVRKIKSTEVHQRRIFQFAQPFLCHYRLCATPEI